MSETEQHDEAWRAQDCLAKAAYVAWVASITADSQVKKIYMQLSSEWQKEAENKSPDHVGGRGRADRTS